MLKSLGLVLLCAGMLRADLAAARAEPNLEKRSDKALVNAEAIVKDLHSRYQSGEWKQVLAVLEEIQESVDLAYESLKQSGKNARKSPKYFKRAEVKTRELVRRLESFSQQIGVDDRPPVEKVRQRIQQVHEELLLAIMSKK